jgi:hypothetical protein
MFAFAPILVAAGVAAPLAAKDALVEGVWADDAGHVITVGKEGRVFTSSDAGATWRANPVATKTNLRAVWNDGQGHTVAVGDAGLVAYRGGGAWKTVTLAPKLPMTAVWGHGSWVFAVGGENNVGVIAWSADSGARWYFSVVHDTVLTAVAGFDHEHVRAVGTRGAIYGTDDGYGWSPIAVPEVVHTDPDGSGTMISNPLVLDDYYSLRYDAGSWLAVGMIGYVVESKDGHAWTRHDGQWAINGTAFHRGADLVLVGAVERSILHAGAWKSTDSNPPAALGKIYRTPSGALYTAAYHGGWTSNPIYYSNSGCPPGSTQTSCPAMIDTPYSGAVMKSIDDGVTWTLLTK